MIRGICPVIDSPQVGYLVKGLYIAVKKVNLKFNLMEIRFEDNKSRFSK
jgi:hypothetical protein